MPAAAAKVIRIELDGFDPDAFEVESFSATEGISKLFSYSVTLAAKDPINDFDKMLEAKAQLSFGEPPVIIHGMLSSVQQGYDGTWATGVGKRTRVDVVLVPDMWKMTLTRRSRFFRDYSVPDILEKVAKEYGLSVDFKCQGNHPKHKTVLQYQETDLEFFQRLAEHEGIHYHFIHGDSEEKVVVADTNEGFETAPDAAALPLRNPKAGAGLNNLGSWGEERTLRRFQGCQKFVTKKVILQDYNDQTPSKDLKVEGEAPGKASSGVKYTYAEHYKDKTQGNVLRDLRKEEILTGKRTYFGVSNAYPLYAGGVFGLTETDDPAIAEDYLVTELQAEGGQPLEHAGRGAAYHFANSFSCIPKSVVFRPAKRTPWPEMKGLYHAKIIASGQYADVEDQGRYRVQFPFDLDGAGSIPTRLMEPYVGGTYGFHAPLHEGVEVLVGFEYGDPDRAIIVAAAHNPDYPNTVASGNHTQSVWRSAGNNEFMMDDTDGSEKFYQHCEKDLEIVTENDKKETTKHDETLEVQNDRTRTVKNNEKVTVDKNREKKIGADETITISGNQSITIDGKREETVKGDKTTTVNGNFDETVDGNENVKVKGTTTFEYTGDHATTMKAKSSVKIDGDSEITVGGGLKESVTGDSEQTVSGGHTQTVTGDVGVETDGDYGLEAGGDIGVETTFGEVGIEGMKVGVEASSELELSGEEVSIEGKTSVEIKSGKYELKSDGEITVKGTTIKLN